MYKIIINVLLRDCADSLDRIYIYIYNSYMAEYLACVPPIEKFRSKYFSDYLPQTDSQKFALDKVSDFCFLIINNKDMLLKDKVFKNAMWLSLSGLPGVGKTHLLNSMKNCLIDNGLDKLLYKTSKVTWSADALSWGKPIIFVDDWFADLHMVSQFNDNCIRQIYETLMHIELEKKVLVSTSNFQFFANRELFTRIATFDGTGRLASRLQVFRAGIIDIQGPDYRSIIAETGTFNLF